MRRKLERYFRAVCALAACPGRFPPAAARAESIEEKTAGLRRLPWRQRQAGRQVDPDDLGTAAGLPLYPAPRLQARRPQERDHAADRLRRWSATTCWRSRSIFRKKPWPDLGQPRAPKDVADRALRANSSVGCTGCHLDRFQGDGTVPRLAGMGRDYMAKTIDDFRSRARGNNPGMTDLMLATSPDDLAALEEYLAGLR